MTKAWVISTKNAPNNGNIMNAVGIGMQSPYLAY
jgi:hypothetical protein